MINKSMMSQVTHHPKRIIMSKITRLSSLVKKMLGRIALSHRPGTRLTLTSLLGHGGYLLWRPGGSNSFSKIRSIASKYRQ